MSHRLYYTEPSRRVFDAVVTRAFAHEGQPAVTLDRTTFYPTSGGQPSDRGRLGTADVVDVVDLDGDVVHVLSTSLVPGNAVQGSIDWTRRFDHMQQHTGQHILSAAFDRLFANRTMSFHLGADISTIDLGAEASAAAIEQAADAANQVVWEDRPVSIRFVTAEEAARLPLRKETPREGELRLIDVEDFDLSACGGTHVARTGSVGAIVVVGTERFRGGTRVTFACGGRAIRIYRTFRDAVSGAVRALSVLPVELPTAVERALGESRDLTKRVQSLQRSLAVHEAARLVSAAPHAGAMRVVVAVLDGWDAPGLKAVASAAIANDGVVAALVSAVSPVLVVIGRSPSVSLDANLALRALVERFGGRGGGTAALAQGGGLAGDPAAIAEAARAQLTAGSS